MNDKHYNFYCNCLSIKSVLLPCNQTKYGFTLNSKVGMQPEVSFFEFLCSSNSWIVINFTSECSKCELIWKLILIKYFSNFQIHCLKMCYKNVLHLKSNTLHHNEIMKITSSKYFSFFSCLSVISRLLLNNTCWNQIIRKYYPLIW